MLCLWLSEVPFPVSAMDSGGEEDLEVSGEGIGEMEAGVIGDRGTEDIADTGDIGLELHGVSPSSSLRT